MGLLAGFAFAIIASLLDPQKRVEQQRGLEACITAFVAALLPLLSASFRYGTTAAEEVLGGRAAIMSLVSAATASVAVLTLFYGLAWLAHWSRSSFVAEVVTRLAASGVTTVTFLYLVISSLNEISIAESKNVRDTGALAIFALMSAFMLIVALAVQRYWHSKRFEHLASALIPRQHPERSIAIASIVQAFLAMIVFGLLLGTEPDTFIPRWGLYLLMGVALAYELVVVLFVHGIPATVDVYRSAQTRHLLDPTVESPEHRYESPQQAEEGE
jgi:uncharacterized protein (DUF486 family)